jgi:hypothetical protein
MHIIGERPFIQEHNLWSENLFHIMCQDFTIIFNFTTLNNVFSIYFL